MKSTTAAVAAVALMAPFPIEGFRVFSLSLSLFKNTKEEFVSPAFSPSAQHWTERSMTKIATCTVRIIFGKSKLSSRSPLNKAKTAPRAENDIDTSYYYHAGICVSVWMYTQCPVSQSRQLPHCSDEAEKRTLFTSVLPCAKWDIWFGC